MSNKVTLRSYGYFLKILNFFGWRNGFLQVGLKLQKLVKKTEGILGVKGSPTLGNPNSTFKPSNLKHPQRNILPKRI
jgi:hypothetical protein